MCRIRSFLSFVAAVAIHSTAFAGPLDDSIRRADENLNDTYQSLMEKLSDKQKASLRKAQREWLRFRDAACAFESRFMTSGSDDWVGKQTTPELDPSCVHNLTRQRASQLARNLRALDGGAASAASQRITPSPSQPSSPSLLPESSATVPTSCRLDNLPSDFTVQAVGVYEGKIDTDVRLDASGHETKSVEVVVNMPEKNVVLVLMAYDPVLWQVKRTPTSRIAAVIVGGYHAQAVVGIERSVPLLISTHDGRKDCAESFYAYEAGPGLLRADTLVKKLTGRQIDHLSSSYGLGTVPVGEPAPANVSLVSSGDYQPEEYTNLPRFPSGQKGIERLIELGLLRRATDEDVNTWVETASARYRRFNPTLSVSKPFAPQGVYTVLGKMRYPEGLFGGHSVAFLIPAGVPTPEGNPGHSAVYHLGNGNCSGAMCPDRQ
jgi:uncharacterized protein YecT (DUF1311 family)